MLVPMGEETVLRAAFILVAAAAVAAAAPIPVTNTGNPWATAPGVYGTTDTAWTVNAGTAYVTVTSDLTDTGALPFTNSSTSYWIRNSVNSPLGPSGGGNPSRWISPQPAYALGLSGDAPGTYTFATTFNYSGLDANPYIQFYAAADNGISQVRLNGNVVLGAIIATPGGHQQWSGVFTISSGFQTGVNTLEFDVINVSSGSGNPSLNNPTGFRAEFATPEPAAVALFGTVALALGFAVRRRRSARG
jgi:hypothetical protein